MNIKTVSVSEARENFSKIGMIVENTGESVTVFKNSKPWLVISPAITNDYLEQNDTLNEETLEAMREVKIMAKNKEPRFETLEEMMESLNV